jgi:hypothetical protein
MMQMLTNMRKYLLITAVLGLTLLGSCQLAASPKVLAAVGPGCYIHTYQDSKITKTDTSACNRLKGFDASKCYLKTVPAGPVTKEPSYIETDCSSISVTTDSGGATAGCYQRASGGYISAGNACNSVKGFDGTKCYIAEANSSDYKQAQCSTITVVQGSVTGQGSCGSGDLSVNTSLNYGCRGTGNPIFDFLFTALRFATVGIGVVMIGSMIVVGLQYTYARGDPNTTAQAKTHLFYIVVALLIYIFAFAILSYLVPGGIF